MSDKQEKPRKIRRRKTTGRVGGTSQSAFASQSMSTILQQQSEEQARKKAKAEDEKNAADADDEKDGNG